MKKILVGFFVMFFCASTAWAITINLGDGGWEYENADTILGFSYVTPADPENEADFANEVLLAYNNNTEGFTYDFELIEYPIVFTKFDGLSGLDITLNAGFTWTYAVVKVDGPNDYSYLFWNTYNDPYLTTPSAGTEPFNMGLNHPQGQGYDISHVTFFGEGGTPVPEPGMVILLGIGLLGLAFYNRKRLLN